MPEGTIRVSEAGSRRPTTRHRPRARCRDFEGAILCFSVHRWHDPRRAGFHSITAALHDLEIPVVFVTVGLSPLSGLAFDGRLRAVARDQGLNRLNEEQPGLATYSWFTPWHPVNLRSGRADRAAAPLWRRYCDFTPRGLEGTLARARGMIIESSPALAQVKALRRCGPEAWCAYRQSDVPQTVGFSRFVADAEKAALPSFDLVSVPDESRREGVAGARSVLVQPHGVDKATFDAATDSPYREPSRGYRAVFAGMIGLDPWFLRIAADRRPDWEFHIFGPFERLASEVSTNVVFHGTRPFAEVAPFLRHADLALNPIDVDQPEFRRETLKMWQYTYNRLPIVASARIAPEWSHVYAYEPGDEASVERALVRASEHSRQAIDQDQVWSWRDMTRELLTALEGES